MNIQEEYLSINQIIDGPIVYAVNLKWFKEFEEKVFESSTEIPQLDNYQICICQEESTQTSQIVNNFRREFDITPKIKNLFVSEQVLKIDRLNQQSYIIVNQSLWDFFVTYFKAGPCVPLYTLSENEVTQSLENAKYLTREDIQLLNKDYILLLDMTVMEFLIQNDDNTFIHINKVVPNFFTIQQVINKILSPFYDLQNHKCYYQCDKRWINQTSTILVSKFMIKSLWFVKNNIGMFSNNNDQIEDSNNEQIQIFKDFQNLAAAGTESTTESRETILDISQQIQEHNQYYEEDTNSSLILRDLDDFKQEIDTILKENSTQTLGLLPLDQIIENVNRIILSLEQDLCFKKEQQEEGTKDELETDI